MGSVQYLLQHQIDKAKWDGCIKNAANSLIYGYSFYLDTMADNWSGIVVNDYEAVMPVVWRKKYFTKYMYQPPFTQQLGVFFKLPPAKTVYSEIESLLLANFPFAEIFLNYANNNCFSPGHCSERVNYVVDINNTYDTIHTGYSPGFTKSLRRIAKFNFEYFPAADIDEVMLLYKKLYGSRVTHLTGKEYAAFKNVCVLLQQKQQLIIRKATGENGVLLAITLLFKDSKRLYNIISCVTEEGKRKEVNYFLYDSIIKEFCNSGLVLDLEGSEIKGVADFYIKMNPANEPYVFYRYNHLHPLLRLIKK